MNWIALEREEQLEQVIADSRQHPVVIFKHSTRCSISTMAKGRLDRSEEPQGMDFYYLDLIKYRSLSNQIAEVFHVHHESPQILLIKDGNCTYEESHNGIDMEELLAQI